MKKDLSKMLELIESHVLQFYVKTMDYSEFRSALHAYFQTAKDLAMEDVEEEELSEDDLN